MKGFTGRDLDHDLSPSSWFTPTQKWSTTKPLRTVGHHMSHGKTRGSKAEPPKAQALDHRSLHGPWS
ncbi:hypothetical protein MTR67_022662 [Solanum verrucosum]|uniref:Uncharacterized protein n=1 Tax=Solanum verrucosum TaxID=315347 RepID=A0AAF0QS66_SOLVR|nr:hypothetical protein MTR67_022662 [Solanum verrucosum]